MMDSALDTLIKIVQVSLDLSEDVTFSTTVEWQEVFDLSIKQGVGAIAFDGVQKLYDRGSEVVAPLYGNELKALKRDWFGFLLGNEVQYEEQCQLIRELAGILHGSGIETMVMKGISLSNYYPVPSHRAVGDIDLYMFGRGSDADKLFLDQLGVSVKQNEDKHSTFKYKGTLVENHAGFLNVVEYPSSSTMESYLEEEAKHGRPFSLGQIRVISPTIMMDAVYLPCHIAGHFMYGGLTLKQLTDWALFVTRFGREIDWDTVFTLSESAGFYSFLLTLNGIVVDKFGVSKDVFPLWERDSKMEERVWKDILLFKTEHDGTPFQRAMRFLSSKWKFNLIYRETFCWTFFRRIWASLRGRYFPGSRSVWDR